jgi:uncharacterized iron-regulated protein
MSKLIYYIEGDQCPTSLKQIKLKYDRSGLLAHSCADIPEFLKDVHPLSIQDAQDMVDAWIDEENIVRIEENPDWETTGLVEPISIAAWVTRND